MCSSSASPAHYLTSTSPATASGMASRHRRRHVHCAGVFDRLEEAVVLSTGTPIYVQFTCCRRCRHRAQKYIREQCFPGTLSHLDLSCNRMQACPCARRPAKNARVRARIHKPECLEPYSRTSASMAHVHVGRSSHVAHIVVGYTVVAYTVQLWTYAVMACRAMAYAAMAYAVRPIQLWPA